MEPIYIDEEILQVLGFELATDGNEVYYQYLLNPTDFVNSPYLATESVEADKFILKGSYRVAVGGEEHLEHWLRLDELTAIVERGYL